LLDSAAEGTVTEGETVTVTSGDATYQVSIAYIDSDEVRYTVNGENAPSSGKLQKGQTYNLSDGAYIGAKDISKLEVSGESGQSTFSIGSGKLEITSGEDVKLNDEAINGLKGYVQQGTPASGAEKIDKIVIEWKTDEEVFLTAEEELTIPGFGAVKFTMGDLVRSEEEKVTIEKDSDTSMQLSVPIKEGDVTFNILYANASGEFTGFGKASDERLLVPVMAGTSNVVYYEKESGNDYHSYFVATYNISKEAESYLLRATVSQDTTNARNETTIQSNVDGEWTTVCEEKIAGDTCDIGSVSITINEVNYTAGGNESLRFSAGTDVNFNTIYTAGGLRIYLPYEGGNSSTAQGLINMTCGSTCTTGHDWDSWYLFMDEEDKDDTLAGGTEFNFTINDNTDNNLQVQQVNNAGTGGPSGLEDDDTSIYEAYIASDVATRILHYTNPDEDWAEVYYPTGDSETYAEVYLAESSVTISDGEGPLGNVVVTDG
jgi:hypothetical protein